MIIPSIVFHLTSQFEIAGELVSVHVSIRVEMYKAGWKLLAIGIRDFQRNKKENKNEKSGEYTALKL